MNTVNLTDIRERLKDKKGQAYWRSLDELADTPEFQEFLHKEFPRQAAPLEGSVDRRDFMKLLGASLALAGLTGCAVPPVREQILPYVRHPEGIVPGRPQFYATALTYGGYAYGALVESHHGRPTKVEGNPDHPASLGATDHFMQAATLNMYDPDRSQAVLSNGSLSSWEAFREALPAALGNLQGRLHILSENTTSPTLIRQVSSLLQNYPGAQWTQYDMSFSDSVRGGSELAFGENVTTLYNFNNADVVLSIGGDFLWGGPGKLAYTRAWSNRRRIRDANADPSRLYVVESTPTLTGAKADHKLPLTPSGLEGFARLVASQLGLGVAAQPVAGVANEWLQALADDLRAHAGRSIIVAGDDLSPELHALVHNLNVALGNVGSTVFYTESVLARNTNNLGQREAMAALANDMRSGAVGALIILGGNPVYNAPADLNFVQALASVPFSVHLSPYVDETSARTTWHVPMTHDFEAWSDARSFEGTASIIQPLISPFYNGRSVHEVVAAVAGEPERSSYDLVRDTWRGYFTDDFDGSWRKALHDGLVQGTGAFMRQVNLQFNAANLPPLPAPQGGMELVIRPDPTIGDGKYSNNGWLQELPKPFTKVTWDNVALISPTTAEAGNLQNGDMVEVSHGGRSVNAPVWITPGQANNTVTLFLGYGRGQAGRIGTEIGYNAYRLLGSNTPLSGAVASVRRTGFTQVLASTQTHHGLFGRHIVRTGTMQEFLAHPEHPEFVHPVTHHQSDLYPDYAYESYAWGMVIDMNTCIGCNACVVACQSENNIPIVGKDQVSMGRELHWLRIDTYYDGDVDNPNVYFQPMLCQHCEKAPCEPVCPVGATVHDHEGLNVMVYNRCVGTRYCSNNCPYKVRRFNFLQYAELGENALSMLQNPDVTVRSRGVMEKCTYCTQRISGARIEAEREGRRIRDGEVVTACQAACPAQAIVFGDINDANARVTREKGSALNYAMLEELNTVPRTSYIAQVTNPHPSLDTSATGTREGTGSH